MKKYFFLLSISFSILAFQSFSQSSLTLEDIWLNNKFVPKSVSGFKGMKDGLHYTEVVSNAASKEKFIIVKSFKTGETTDTLLKSHWLLPPDSLKPISFDSYSFNADESKILISIQTEKIYRRSSKSFFFVYDLKTQKTIPVSKNGKQIAATFSPDGTKVAFVRDNNLFITLLLTGTETAVTNNGKKNELINGITDWVYEEEFAFVQAYQWSPDSRYIAFMRFDESKVPEYTIQYFNDLYPENYTYKYPKVGEQNSVVSLFVYNVLGKSTAFIDCGGDDSQYFPRMLWTQNANELCITRLNRLQNKLDLLLANVDSTVNMSGPNVRLQSPFTIVAKIFFTETNDRYIDINNDLTFFNHNQNFIWTSSINGFHHIYIYNLKGELIQQVTNGNWDVTNFYGIDEKSNTIYFQSAEVSPLERYVYSIKTDGTDKKQLTNSIGANDAEFTPGFFYFMNNHSDANTPNDFSLCSNDGKVIRVLQDNSDLKNALKSYHLNPKTFFNFNIADGTSLNGFIIKPANFDSTKKYPVYMFCYGGPGSQKVLNAWAGYDFMFHEFITQHDYIVVCVDNRGTGARGQDFQKITYLQLGKYETDDQIAAAKYLQSKTFVDPARIGMFGWSFGGYMAARCITLGSDVFKTAVAVAPVTDWRFYDSVYTERYMRTDTDNKAGYDSTSVLNYVKRIEGKLLLIHGLADDNVHYQNSAMFIKTLYQNNIDFSQLTFPDKNHGISGGNTRFYLYNQVSDFIFNNL